jgi:hypothetical protein
MEKLHFHSKRSGESDVSEDYLAFGLHIRSGILLPGLPPFQGTSDRPTIRIRLGHIEAERPSDGRPISTSGQPNDVVLNFRGIGRFQIRSGEEIVAEPSRNVEPSMLRLHLLGTALAVLCYQRGLQPFHATAISVADHCVAFAGTSGSGKSTLAAFLSKRGYGVLCDDLCVLSFERDERAFAWPGMTSFKLSNDAIKALGCGERNVEKVPGDREKYHLPNPTAASSAPLPFSRLYILNVVAPPHRTAIRPLRGADALRAYVHNIYRPKILKRLKQEAVPFINGLKVLRHAQVYVFERVWDLSHLNDDIDLLEQHFDIRDP